MKLPSELRIGPVLFKIHYKKDWPKKGKAWAQLNLPECTIYVDSSGSDEFILECLMHEALHGIIAFSAVNFDNEETIIKAISPYLVSFIRDNKDFVERF